MPLLGAATAADNCGVASVVATRSDGRAVAEPFPVGVTTVTWTATDVHGNKATCTQRVTVKDAEKPVIASAVPSVDASTLRRSSATSRRRCFQNASSSCSS